MRKKNFNNIVGINVFFFFCGRYSFVFQQSLTHLIDVECFSPAPEGAKADMVTSRMFVLTEESPRRRRRLLPDAAEAAAAAATTTMRRPLIDGAAAAADDDDGSLADLDTVTLPHCCC